MFVLFRFGLNLLNRMYQAKSIKEQDHESKYNNLVHIKKKIIGGLCDFYFTPRVLTPALLMVCATLIEKKDV